MIDNIDDLKKELISSGIAQDYELVGAHDREINEIERRYGTLPDSYRQIMQLLGRRAGKLVSRGEFEFYIDQTLLLNESILEARREDIMEGETILELPEENTYFITARLGDNQEFLLTNIGNNSPVYDYGFPYGGVTELYPSVWTWIQSFIDDSKALMKLQENIDRQYY
jgi:hypothetical protein